MIWLLCTPIIESFLRSCKTALTDFFSYYLSFWFISIFEFGAIFESLRNRCLLMLHRKIVYGKGQLVFEWDNRVIKSWSYTLTLIVFLFVLLIGSGGLW